jgi:hypothetical protein
VRKKQETGEDCVMRSFIIFSSPNIVKVIKSRRMRWAWHLALMVKIKIILFFFGKSEDMRLLGRHRLRYNFARTLLHVVT